MHTIEELQKKVKLGFENFHLPKSPKELYDPMVYLLHLSGKRIRPCLLLMGANLFRRDIDDFIPQAMAMEIFHNFTLMHDDIMDQAPLRRGSPTVHEKWNTPIAILSGDAMLVESYKLLLKSPESYLWPVMDLFNTTATQVCEGQQLDMNFESGGKINIEDYLHMIELKTAVLLGACIKLGCILGGADLIDQNHAYEFGKNLGIAFQLQDDLLDVYGDEGKFGKQIGGDILANKKTFLLLKALELAKGDMLMELESWISDQNFDSLMKIKSVTAIYNKLGIAGFVEERIKFYHENALNHLNSISVEACLKDNLENLSDTLLNRQH